jgi:hypothetical protein
VAETLGSLVDKLTVVNLRIWMLEDVKRDATDDHAIAEATRKTNVLNQQRSDLIQEIDELVIGLVSGTKQMKSYGQGTTKAYGKG